MARLSRLALLSSLLAPVFGCSRIAGPIGEHHDGPPQRGGTMELGTFSDLRNLDPALAFDTTAQSLEQLLYAKLVDYDHDTNIVPMLAEKYEVSADGKRYSFKLHEGILFHDGTELTADDVKRSIERTLDPDTPCPAPSFYASIAGYEEFHDGKKDASGKKVFAPELKGVVVDGKYALHIDLSTPDATFLPAATLPFLAPLCKSAGRKYEREWGNHACGAGPFRLQEWQAAREVTLVRHDGYFRPGQPYLDKVHWYLLMPGLSQRFKFERGDLDHVSELNMTDLVSYRADPRWKPFSQWEPAKATQGVFLNNELPPFDNVEMRRAFAAAIDWGEVAAMRPDQFIVTGQMVPPAVPGHDPSFQGQKHDVAAALEHMKNAGYPFDPATGRGGYPEPVRYVGPAESAATELVAPVLAQQLAKVGIHLEIKQLSWPSFLAQTALRKTVQLGYGGWSMDFPDPSDFFEPILSSENIQEEESQNMAFFSNPEFDALLKKAHNEIDPASRAAMYKRCEEIVRDQAPWALGMNARSFEIVQPYVHNYVVDKAHVVDVREVWLDTKEQPRSALVPKRRDALLGLIRPWGKR
jgi:ABC-type transport system substrate-binding protein